MACSCSPDPLDSSRVHCQRRPSKGGLLRQYVPQRAADRALRDGVQGRRRPVDGARRAPPLLPRLLRRRTYAPNFTDLIPS